MWEVSLDIMHVHPELKLRLTQLSKCFGYHTPRVATKHPVQSKICNDNCRTLAQPMKMLEFIFFKKIVTIDWWWNFLQLLRRLPRWQFGNVFGRVPLGFCVCSGLLRYISLLICFAIKYAGMMHFTTLFLIRFCTSYVQLLILLSLTYSVCVFCLFVPGVLVLFILWLSLCFFLSISVVFTFSKHNCRLCDISLF